VGPTRRHSARLSWLVSKYVIRHLIPGKPRLSCNQQILIPTVTRPNTCLNFWAQWRSWRPLFRHYAVHIIRCSSLRNQSPSLCILGKVLFEFPWSWNLTLVSSTPAVILNLLLRQQSSQFRKTIPPCSVHFHPSSVANCFGIHLFPHHRRCSA
jgi:hypothetical protein